MIDAAIVTESAVLAAQRRYLRPVFGVSFYGALEQGRYGAFLAEYVRPALALFVKYLVLPDAAVRLGRLGIVRFGGEYFEPTDGAARPAREYKTAALRGRGRGALTGRFGRVRMTRRGVPGGTPLVYL